LQYRNIVTLSFPFNLQFKALPESRVRSLAQPVKTVKVKNKADYLTEMIVHVLLVEAGNESQPEM